MNESQPDKPEHSDEEVDRRFDELVADWEQQDAPESEPKPFQVPAQWRSSTGPQIIDQHEPEFVPPEPSPLPSDEGFWVTVGCLVVGPLWLLYLFFFDRYAATLWWVLALAIMLVGGVLLVVRQPKNREEDDPFDDGARL